MLISCRCYHASLLYPSAEGSLLKEKHSFMRLGQTLRCGVDFPCSSVLLFGVLTWLIEETTTVQKHIKNAASLAKP